MIIKISITSLPATPITPCLQLRNYTECHKSGQTFTDINSERARVRCQISTTLYIIALYMIVILSLPPFTFFMESNVKVATPYLHVSTGEWMALPIPHLRTEQHEQSSSLSNRKSTHVHKGAQKLEKYVVLLRTLFIAYSTFLSHSCRNPQFHLKYHYYVEPFDSSCERKLVCMRVVMQK